MTVRELIAELQKLDQDKGIWVEYDGFSYFPPIPDGKAEEIVDHQFVYDTGVVNEGDYIIIAN